MIDYAQLGLLFKLYSCEVLFNRGLCYIYLQQKEAGMQDLAYAVKEKVVEDHNVIDEAIREEAEVSLIRNPSNMKGVAYRTTGLYSIFYSCRCCVSTKRGQSPQFENQRLSRQGQIGCGLGPIQCIYRVCRL